MAGFDIPTRLKRSVGRGKILAAAVIEEQLRAIDRDEDGRLTRKELAGYFLDAGFGGSWLCQMVAGTIWQTVDPEIHESQKDLDISLLARVIHLLMARKERGKKRYDIRPETFNPRPYVELQEPTMVSAPVVGRTPAAPNRPRHKPVAPRTNRPSKRPVARPGVRPAGRPRS